MSNASQSNGSPIGASDVADITQAATTEFRSPDDPTDPATRPGIGTSTTQVLNPTAGTMVDQYRLDQKLGEGGMGTVWKAFHVNLEKHVAIKILPPTLTREPRLVARFKREMIAVAKVDHRNVVRAMDAGEFGGLHYLVMEYVEGTDLNNLVRARGPQPVRNACELIRQAALGLSAAHQLGLVHRDVKPSNLFLTKARDAAAGSIVKVLDLGLARLSDEASGPDKGVSLTGHGNVMGTPDYMAPEQWENTHAVDPRADLYSLGCTFYFLLTGRPPFGDDAHSSLASKILGHTHEPAPDLRAARASANRTGKPLDDVPDSVVSLCQRLMAKSPQDRVQSAGDLAAALLGMIKDMGGGEISTAAARPEDKRETKDASARDSAILQKAPREVRSGSNTSSESRLKPATPADARRKTAKARTDEFEEITEDELLDDDFDPAPAVAPRGRRAASPAGHSRGQSGTGIPSWVWVACASGAPLLLVSAVILWIAFKDGSSTPIKVPDGTKIEISKSDERAPAAAIPAAAVPSAAVEINSSNPNVQPAAQAAPVEIPAAPGRQGWTELRAAGILSAMFPGVPKESVTNVASGRDTRESRTWLLVDGDRRVGFNIAYTDFTGIVGQEAKRLQNGRDGAIEAVKGRLLREQKLDFPGGTGLEFFAEGKQGDSTLFVRAQMKLFGQRMYLSMIVSSEEARLMGDDPDYFFQSIRPLDPVRRN